MKNLLILVVALFGIVLASGLAYSKEITVDMLNKRADGEKMVYSQDVIKVKSGDIVTWLPKTKGHNVEFIGVPEGVKKIKKSKLHKKVSYTFVTPGIYLYQCTPHKSMGMIGLVIVDDNIDNKAKIAKAKVRGKSKKKLKKLLSDI